MNFTGFQRSKSLFTLSNSRADLNAILRGLTYYAGFADFSSLRSNNRTEFMKSAFTIELRIYGQDLDISRATKDLGLKPTSVQLKGELGSGDKPFSKSMWGYGESENRSLREWDDLEAGLASLLATLDSKKDELERYRLVSSMYLWCGYFHSSFAPTITLSPSILSAVGKFGAVLEISSYYCEDE